MNPRALAQAGAAALVTLAWTARVLAYRPFDGTDADVAAARELEFEVGPLNYERQNAENLLIVPALVLNYGFAPRWEAVLEGRNRWPVQRSSRPEVEDVALSVKSLLREGSLQGQSGLSIAIETGVLLPASERRFGVQLAGIASLSSPALTLHFNLGNALLTSLDDTVTASLIVEGPLAWRVRPVGEALVERDFAEPSVEHGFGVSELAGLIVSSGDELSFDLAYRHYHARGVKDEQVRAGFTWAFEVR
jgi:hypothetical protein